MNAESRTADLLHRNPTAKKEILEKINRGELKEVERFGVSPDKLVAFIEGRTAITRLEARAGQPETVESRALEAIVRKYGRPVLLIRNGKYEAPALPSVLEQLRPHRERIERAIGSVGRVEFINHAMPWGGTGWLVDRNVVVTNRHVAELVAEADARGGYRFRMSVAGVPFGAKLDLREEHGVTVTEELSLKRVRLITRTDQPDIALLEVDVDGNIPEPLSLVERVVSPGQAVGLIGYPAYDSRNDPQDVARYFGDIFDVKRLAPGEVTQPTGAQHFFMHDATTLGGNSGSVVLDLESGQAAGLHFAGSYLVGNYAVSAEQVKRALRGLRTTVSVPAEIATFERADGSHRPDYFRDRTGYADDFLGTGARRVSVPGLGDWAEDAAEISDDDSSATKLIPYTHFSVAFSRSRKVPIFTAVNINGDESKKVKRGDDQWFCDLRLPREIQLTRQDYDHPDIDRGHMVRREDPNWGTVATARIANDDTFHYTNAAPQHARLNQGKTQWLGLEDYVLSNARTEGLRVTVFTGPVLRSEDRALENGLRVPEEFWKVIVSIDDGGKLRATGYVLSQGRLIEDITEGFVYGQYRTYQVLVELIAKTTTLEFGPLVAADPLKTHAITEAAAGVPPIVPLDRLESMVL